jgi:hypothetical protein
VENGGKYIDFDGTGFGSLREPATLSSGRTGPRCSRFVGAPRGGWFRGMFCAVLVPLNFSLISTFASVNHLF